MTSETVLAADSSSTGCFIPMGSAIAQSAVPVAHLRLEKVFAKEPFGWNL